jgi:hypothetical protein
METAKIKKGSYYYHYDENGKHTHISPATLFNKLRIRLIRLIFGTPKNTKIS